MRLLYAGDSRLDGAFLGQVLRLADYTSGFDYVVLNLETAIGKPGDARAAKSHAIVASYAEVEQLAERFGARLVLNLNNNHVLDAGRGALDRFIGWLEKRGIPFVDGQRSAVLGTGRERVCLQAYAYWKAKLGFLDCRSDRVARPQAPCLDQEMLHVALMHWGEEYVFFPSPSQQEAARQLAEAGFRYVIGSHPHVVQGTERMADTEVYYSLGNACFAVAGQLRGAGLGMLIEMEVWPGEVKLTRHAILSQGPDGEWCAGPWTSEALDAWWSKLGRCKSSTSRWYQEAARPFLGNHLPSWSSRLRRFGGLDWLRFIRAMVSPEYLRMFAGACRVRGRETLNDRLASEAEVILARGLLSGESSGASLTTVED
jgi:hypothetical protein